MPSCSADVSSQDAPNCKHVYRSKRASGAMFKLSCPVQQYAWGRLGSASVVARLKQGGEEGFQVDECSPYAELWMGTHPNGPADVLHDDGSVPLLQHVQENPSQLNSSGKSQGDLPFLFKVLSVNTALSIQAHPHKELAARLHSEQPNMYKDGNHKPEMAIALTEFLAMCGFRPLAETIANIDQTPEFAGLLSAETKGVLEQFKHQTVSEQECARAIFTNYMHADPEAANAALSSYIGRLGGKSEQSFEEQLVVRLSEQYPGDPGAFAPLLLNCIKLQPGEAFFMGPDEPHAYLYGDILECMACSDNVVRAGLTPKFKDIDTLCSMLTYRCGTPHYITSSAVDEYTRAYIPPVQEFEVANTNLPAETNYSLPRLQDASILLVLQGGGSFIHASRSAEATEGTILFIGAGEDVQVQSSEAGVHFSRAYANQSSDCGAYKLTC